MIAELDLHKALTQIRNLRNGGIASKAGKALGEPLIESLPNALVVEGAGVRHFVL